MLFLNVNIFNQNTIIVREVLRHMNIKCTWSNFIFVRTNDTKMDIEMFVLTDKNSVNFEINCLQSFPIAPYIINTSSVKLLCPTSSFVLVFHMIPGTIRSSGLSENAFWSFIEKTLPLNSSLASFFLLLDDGKRFYPEHVTRLVQWKPHLTAL